MTILAIETTGSTCGAAVADLTSTGMVLRSLAEVHQANVHDERLAPLVATALEATNVTLAEIDVVAVSAGPGSFTGTRIGVSFAKGLTIGGSPKLLLVDTSAAMALATREVALLSERSQIMTVIPSHRSLYYVDRFTMANDVVVREGGSLEPTLMGLDELDPTGYVLCGPGARDVDPKAISGLTRLSARFAALYACTAISAGYAVYADPLTATPLYRQDFVGR